MKRKNHINIQEQKKAILQKIKANGGFWSYNSIPQKLNDDEIIEEALRHLDFEDMDEIFTLWSKAHIKRIWKNKMLSEGERLKSLNTLLGILFFDIKDIDKYLKKHDSNPPNR